MKLVKTVIFCLIFSISISVSVFAAPAPGVYEKRHSDGTMARMMVIVAEGYCNSAKWLAPAERPYIVLQGFENGKQVIEIAARYDEQKDNSGSAAYGLIYDENGLAELKNYKGAKAQRISHNITIGSIKNINGCISFKTSSKINVKKSEILDGLYIPVNTIPQLTVPLVQFAMEVGMYADYYFPTDSNINLSEIMAKETILQTPRNITGVTVWGDNIPRETCYINRDFSLIMIENENQRTYSFPLVGENYPQCCGDWQNFKGSTDTETNAMYLFQHIWQTRQDYQQELKHSILYLRFSDFYTGEGPGAVTTCEYRLLATDPVGDPGKTEIERYAVNDNGKIMIMESY